MESEPISRQGRRPNWPLLIALVLLHLAALYGLARAFAPDLTGAVERQVVSAFTVTVTTPDPPQAPPAPDEGAQGDPGRKAIPREDTAPKSPIRNPEAQPRPRASSTGSANQSGANRSGDGSGAAGQGDGPGSGAGGGGSGNGQTPDLSRKVSVASGSIDNARDFPIPEGGRSVRVGTKIEAVFTVTPDGRATNCSITNSTADAQATALLCSLIQQKIRFNPALNRDGQPITARFGWRQTFGKR